MKVDKTAIEVAALTILQAIGEDVDRPELADTPKRFAKWWTEFIDYEDDNRAKMFPRVSQVDQMVVVQGIRVWSLCEHHLLPFWCDISIGYIAQDGVLGLSKFGRIAHFHAHKLQVQERLVTEIAQEVMEVTGSESVAVVAKGEHLCMTMRGIKSPSKMISSSLHGAFRDIPSARAEFMALVND